MTDETYFKPKARLQRLAKVQKMVRDAYRQGGIKTWNAYQTNRLPVTGKEADNGLDKLDASQDVPSPQCHAGPTPHA